MSASRARRLWIGILLAIGLLFLFFRGLDWTSIRGAFRSADPLFMAGVVAITVSTYLVRAWRWGYLLSPLARVPFFRLFSATFVGFATGLVVPRAGEVVRPYLIARRHPVKVSAAFASIVLERLLDLLTVLLLFGLYMTLLPAPPAQKPGPLLNALRAGGVLAGVGALALLGLLLALHIRAEPVLGFLDRLLERLPSRIGGPASRALRSFTEGLAVLQAPARHLLVIAGQSLLLWLGIALGIHWNNRAFGLDLPYHSAFLILTFLLVGVSVPTPAMVGGFHESYLLALTESFGVDKATAAAAGIACHALTNVPVLLLGLLGLGYEGLTLGGVARMTAVETPPPGTDPPGREGEARRGRNAMPWTEQGRPGLEP